MLAVRGVRVRAGPGRVRRGELGSLSLELVLVVPVLVLLTVFVLWAGRGGRAALTADLAAEEAATAAALCCEEGTGGDSGREALVEDVLEARPGLGFLCIGGLRPDAGVGSDEFLSEHWLEFELGRGAGGVGVLGVQFLCESDGAVAPLRGLFPTVTFHGQASEVVVQEPRFVVGFEPTRVEVTEGTDLVFTVKVQPAQGQEVTLTYEIDPATTAEPEDFGDGATDFMTLLGLNSSGEGTVVIPANADSAEISLPLFDDDFFEGTEELVLELTGAEPVDIQLDAARLTATGVIKDNDPEPHLFIAGPDPSKEVEGGTRTGPNTVTAGTLTFQVRLRNENNTADAPSATAVSVVVRIEDITTTAGYDYELPPDTWTGGITTLTFDPGTVAIDVVVQTLDDTEGEIDEETFKLVLENAGAPLGFTAEAVGTIIDDEARVSVESVRVDEGDASSPGMLQFQVVLDRAINADLTLQYELVDPDASFALDTAQRGMPPCAAAVDDYLDLDPTPGTLLIEWPHDPQEAVDLPGVTVCGDSVVEPDETLWLSMSVPRGVDAVMEPDGGAFGTIVNDDIPTVSIVAFPADATGTEGDPIEFTVRLTVGGQPAQLTQNITVDYTVGGSGTDAATDPEMSPAQLGADYSVTLDIPSDLDPPELYGSAPSGTLSGTLTFTPVVTEHVFSAVLLPDDLPENPETFRLELTNPSRAGLFDGDPDLPEPTELVAVATIEDDPPPVLSVSGFTGAEGTTRSFTVTLDDPRAGDVKVDYAITGDEVAANGDTATAEGHPTKAADFDAVPSVSDVPAGSLRGTLTFAPPTTSETVDVALLRDTVASEPDETLRLTLTNPRGAVLSGSDAVSVVTEIHATGTIGDEDPPALFVDNTEAREGLPLTFTVTLCNPIRGEEVTVKYRTQARSAAAGLDFTPRDGTLTFSDEPLDANHVATQSVTEGCGAGVTADAKSLTVEVETLDDGKEESEEEVHLILSEQSPDHIGFGDSLGVGTIINVNGATVRVSNPTAVEGDLLRFVISLKDETGGVVGDQAPDAAIAKPVTVHYRTAVRTADAGAACSVAGTDYDYVAPSAGSFTFQSNDTVRAHTVPVATCTDTEDEDDETVALILWFADEPDNASIGDSEGTGTIEDADPPSIHIADAAADEGDTLTFAVTLVDADGDPATTSENVTVYAATEDRTATAGDDYTAVVPPRLLTIRAGESTTTMTFDVATILDDEGERPETFSVLLSAATNAKIDRAIAIGTINEPCVVENPEPAELADHQPPIMTLHDATVVEGSDSFPYLVSFSRQMCGSPQFALQPLWGGGFGTADCDEVSVPGVDGDFRAFGYLCSENIPFVSRGLSSHSTASSLFDLQSVNLIDDNLDEDEEWFTIRVRWGPDMPARFPKSASDWVSARVTIIDDDPPPHLSIADAAADEGDPITFTISLDAESGRPVTVQYRTVDLSATAGVDYTAAGWTSVTFMPGPPGDTSQTFEVATIDDGAGDSGETFLVELRAPVSADPANPAPPLNALIVDGVAVGTILEGDLPELRIRDASADEGSAMGFEVVLSEPATQNVTATYSTVERPADLRAADEGTDYTSVSGTVEIPVGATTPTAATAISVPILDDSDAEVDETFLVELSNVTGAVLADPSAVGTINGDTTCVDTTVPGAVPPPWTVDSPTALEGDGQMTFTIEVEQPICHSADFHIQAAYPEGSALHGIDWVIEGQQVSSALLPQLATEVSFQVDLVDDDIAEPPETIRVHVSASQFGSMVAEGTIIDDDQASLSVGDVSGAEGGFLNFVIRLGGRTESAVTVDYATEDASPLSAVAGADYRARPGTAVIAAGELSATVAVFAPQDGLDEDAETFLLRLSDPTGRAELAPGGDVAVGTIRDDDPPPEARVSDASTDEGGTLEFVVTLDVPSGREVSVPVATSDGTAKAGDGDYVTLTSTHVVFAPGVTREVVRVQTLADAVVETSEIVWLDLGPMDVGNDTATIGDGLGRGVIRDVSNRRMSVSDASVVEGGALAFEVGFAEGPSGRDVTVRYRTRAGTATAGDDYDDDFESATSELRIVAGDTSAWVLVPTAPDRIDEDIETLELVLSGPVGAVIVDGTASGTIRDNDPEPALRVSNTEATEADGASATFTLTLSEASGRDVFVEYETADGTANAGADYTAPTDPTPMTTITAGDTTATVVVALVNDDVEEDVEAFQLRVTGAVNAQRDDFTGVATIIDDDGPIQIIVDDPADVSEGDGATAAFPVRLSRADPANAVTVAYATVDGTAIAGADYTAPAADARTLTFPAGDTTETVMVPLINDDVIEDAETFRLVLSDPSSNAEIGDGEATVLIRDDDGLATLSVADAAAATEGSTAAFNITLSRAVAHDVTVDYGAIADPTAADEAAAAESLDYRATSGTATVAARSTSTTVSVPLLADSFDENTETFWLRLAGPAGATVADGTATGTINDDDPLPVVNIYDAGAREAATLRFEVTLDTVSGRTVTVPWTTEALPAGETAASPGADYTTASGTATFAPGTTAATIDVESLPDDIAEADERFRVQLGTPANAALDDSTAVGAIRDDDGEPRISIAPTTVNEHEGPAIFSVTLSHPSSLPVTVGYDTADGTATTHTATTPGDYAPDEVRTLTIPAAVTAGEISVFINDDTEAEGTETFTIALTDPVNAVIAEGAGTATGTILDDEGTPRLSVSNAGECEDGSSLADCEVRACRTGQGWSSYEEFMACQAILADPGACQEGMCGGDGMLEFAVQLSHTSTEETSVDYSTFAASAANPRDYVATTGTLTIPAGDTTASIPVTLVDDGVPEQRTETFRLVLDDAAGVELETEHATGTIHDDDPMPRVSAAPFDSLLANENDGFAYHRVTLSHPSDLPSSADYTFEAVLDRSPFAGIDDTQGTITFAPGVVEQTIGVPLLDNDVATYTPGYTSAYATTTYRILLSGLVNLSRGLDTGSGVVWDDETPPYVERVSALDVLEGAGSTTFTITLNRFSDTAVTATYRTADGTATAGSDYTATEATVTFPAGTLAADVSVPILDDTDIEPSETFTLSVIDDPRNSNLTYLANPIGVGEHGVGSGTTTILDDDSTPVVSVADTAANENAGTMEFWVALSRVSATDVTVRYATADGTATAGSDYTAADSIVTIEAGARGAAVSVAILDDGDDTESDETFTLTLSEASGADLAADGTTATATIIEDSDLPFITISDRSSTEGRRLLGRHMSFSVRLSEPSSRAIVVNWEIVEVPELGDEAATVGSDFFPTSVSNTLTSPTSGVLRIRAGATGALITLEIVADVIPERDERFQIILSNPQGALLQDGLAWGTIENDDLPIVTVADAEASEADDAVVFNLQLHAPGLDLGTLSYTTVVRTFEGDRAATPGDDYTTASGTLDIPAGATTATISVPIIADTSDEEDETFLLVLTSPENLDFRDGVAVGTITDDDDGYWIRDRSVWENAGTMDFTVQRDHTSTSPVTVNYRIDTGGSAVGGTACTDDDGNYIADYVTPSGTVTMPAATTTATISIDVCDDDDAEGRENLLVELTGVTGRQTIAVGTIVDDDRTDQPRINIGDSASRAETLHDTLGAQFQITADRVLRGDVTVTWQTEDCLATDTLCPNPAAAGTDYTAAGGTVTLTPTNPSATVTVTVLNDTTDEDNEQFFVRITDVTAPAVIGSGATHADPVGIGRITDDDGQPTLYVRDSCAVEGDVARIPVELSHAHTSHLFATFRVTGGTATRRDDIGRIGSLNLAERDTTDYIEIEVIQDNIPEGTETLEFELNVDSSDLTGIELGDATATLTIREDSCP